MTSRRIERIASRIRFLVSSIIQRELGDPRIGMVTILRVEPSKDLRDAKVYLSIFGDEGVQSRSFHALESARGYIQREVGKNLETRSTPQLRFILDDTLDNLSRFESLLEKVTQEGHDGEKTDQKDAEEVEILGSEESRGAQENHGS